LFVTIFREEVEKLNRSVDEEFIASTLPNTPERAHNVETHALTSTPNNELQPDNRHKNTDQPDQKNQTRPESNLYHPNNIETVHASIARSIASRFEESIKERIRQRSVREVRAIEEAVGKALERLEIDSDRHRVAKKNEQAGTKKKKGKKMYQRTTQGKGKEASEGEITTRMSRRHRRKTVQ